MRAVLESRFSIHDLSRCTGEGDENYARFNMPLELGFAMARSYIERAGSHDWLVMVPRGHVYLRFVSDLAAFDPATHDGSRTSVVIPVVAWLLTRDVPTIASMNPRAVLDALPRFEAEKRELEMTWGGQPPWSDIVLTAARITQAIQ